ncbi:MAG: endonuclease III [Clostridiales bacterium]|nr:endonuclease III [Clostridiales bacterium]
MKRKEKVKEILKVLTKEYGDAKCTLEYNTPLELLVATCLAAQCTDARVNIVTKELFRKYKDIYDFAKADVKELEIDIKPTGFYRNKARNIIDACNKMISDFDAKVPDNMEDLLTLPGVGRKTANLILGEVYNESAVVVDTHCMRITTKLGLTDKTSATKIECDLKNIIEPKDQLLFCHLMVSHGRAVCKARNPKCSNCSIRDLCEKMLLK